ncbi:MAG: hypothetical protein JXA73_03830 [Acidobacteria bacterium]|nr:hypothetical protein [Acidobacteriota bacterium]
MIRTGLAKASDKVIHYRYEIRKESTGQLPATGETKHVVTNMNFRPARLPKIIGSFFCCHPGLIDD